MLARLSGRHADLLPATGRTLEHVAVYFMSPASAGLVSARVPGFVDRKNLENDVDMC